MICYCFFCRAAHKPELFVVRDLLQSGYARVFVMQKTGVAGGTYLRVAKEWGLPVGRYTRFKDVRGRVAVMVGERVSFTDIAKTLNVSRKTVASYFPGEGFTRVEQAERSRLAAFERGLKL